MEEQPRLKREKPKKASTLTMRLTQQTRSALEKAAEAEGRSISEMAERWLDLAAQGKADIAGRLGGGALAETMTTIAAFAALLVQQVEQLHPDLGVADPTEDLGVRAALVGGAARLFALTYPIRGHGASTPDPGAQRTALIRACATCRDALSRIIAPPDAANDLEAFDILSRVANSEVNGPALAALAEALTRVATMGDEAFKIQVDAAQTALAAHAAAVQDERAALAQWSAFGRNVAETLARAELHHRAYVQARRVASELPGTGFAFGGVMSMNAAADIAHFERESDVADLAERM